MQIITSLLQQQQQLVIYAPYKNALLLDDRLGNVIKYIDNVR